MRGHLFGLALGLSAALLGLSPLGGLLEESIGLDLLFGLRGSRTPPAPVVTVAIDREAATALNAPDEPTLWPRTLHARLLRKLRTAGAEIVVFTLFFGDAREGQDADLSREMTAAGNVVLASFLRLKHAMGDAYVETLEPPTETLAGAALHTAPLLLAQGAEAIRFLTWHGERLDQPTLPFVVSHQYLTRVLRRDPAEEGASFDWSRVPDEALLRRAVQALGTVTAERAPRHFDHYGPAGTIPRLAYQRLLTTEDEALPDLRGKIVLIGFAEDFQPEEHLQLGPYSAVGSLELAATAVANLLEDRSVRPLLGPIGQSVGLLAFGVLIGLLAQRARIAGCAGAVILAAANYLGLAVLVFSHWGYWLPLVIPLLWLAPMGLLGCLVSNYWRRTREQQRLHTAIQRFIPVEVASRLIHPEGRQDWDGQLRFGVCLACDAGQYTALAEKTDPMALGELMNAYYGTLFPVVTRRGGWVSDVVGDAMMAIWVGDEHDAELRVNALHAALAMQEAVAAFERARGVRLPLRISLHGGPMRVGFVGASDHGEYRAVGDTVNTAARLEGLNKLLGTRILVSDVLLTGCAACLTRPLGSFLLAGKSQPVLVHELIATLEQPENPLRRHVRKRFATALALFQQGQWRAALAIFDELAMLAPEDGPVRFYREAARARLDAPEPLTERGVIRAEKPSPGRHKEI
jgi:adenylate cyclase